MWKKFLNFGLVKADLIVMRRHVCLKLIMALGLGFSVIGCSAKNGVDNSIQGSIGRGYEFTISDPTAPTGSAYTSTIQINISSKDASISSWCVSETQTTQPADGGACNGGAWTSTKPTSITLSAGSGLKTIYVWAANGNGKVKNNTKATSATINRVFPPVVTWTTPAATVNQQANSYNFSWSATDVGGPGLAALNTYKVERFDNAGCSGAAASTTMQDLASTNINLLGLADGTYSVRVTAYDILGLASTPVCSSDVLVDATAPTVTISSGPTQPVETVSGATFNFTITDGGPSGVASINCYLDAVLQGACTTTYSFASIADGNHTFRIIAVDNAGNSTTTDYAWNINTLSISGTAFFVTQTGTAWSQNFTGSGGTGAANYTWSVFSGPGSAGGNGTATGSLSYTPLSSTKSTMVLRLTDTVSTNTKDYTVVLEDYVPSVCVWNGSVSTVWSNAANWSYCLGVAPTTTDAVAIPSVAPNMPTTGSITIDRFGLGPGGGILTVSVGATVTLNNGTQTFQSSVQLQGATTTCTTCIVTSQFTPQTNIYIINDAVVTLLKGIGFAAANQRGIYLGNGTTGGSVYTGPASALQTEWPRFGITSSANNSINLSGGSATSRSTIKFDGVVLNMHYPYVNTGQVYFNNWWNILQFDNVVLDEYSNGTLSDMNNIQFVNCNNGVVSDTTWTNITFTDVVNQSVNKYNVNAGGTNCDTLLPVITISPPAGTNGGLGYGALYELDPGNKITWTNGATYICTWTGANSVTWTDPGNWNNCANSRYGYPDQNDEVIIPSGPANQPVIAASTAIKGFALSGAGGGTITVNNTRTLWITGGNSAFQSDIAFMGNTTTCTTCVVQPLGDTAITQNSTLTLKTGINLAIENGKYFRIGNGTAGHFTTAPASAIEAEWPRLGNGTNFILVNGTPGQYSRININGLVFSQSLCRAANNCLNFVDYYEIQNFDKFKFLGATFALTGARGAVNFIGCSFATITDTNWDDITFSSLMENYTGGLGVNILANGTNCNTLPAITITNPAGTNGGFMYGDYYENDPNGKLNWSNSTNFTCTWNGATSTSWTDPTNWTGCTNGRGNYPDQLDYIIIPSAPVNQPTVAAQTQVRGVALAPSASAGGTITVNAGIYLYFTQPNSTIRSDIKFKGATAGCTNCYIGASSYVKITDSAKVTAMAGASFGSWAAVVNDTMWVGDGVTAGHFVAVANSKIPRTQIVVLGVAAERSTIDISGGTILDQWGGGQDIIEFRDWYEIKNLDNLTFSSGWQLWTAGAGVKFTDCTNALITDTSWDGWSIQALTTGKNVNASGTNCAGLTPINVSAATGAGAGAAYEVDPSGRISWP